MKSLQSRLSKERHTPGCLYDPRKKKNEYKLNECSTKEVIGKQKYQKVQKVINKHKF